MLVDRIIIVNPDWQNSFVHTRGLLSAYKHKILVVENGIDTELFKPVGQKRYDELLCVSILDKYHVFKGIEYLIDAIKEVMYTIPDIHLTVIGEGELKETYMRQVQEQGIEKNVTFVGYKDQSELSHYYSQAQLFILPSVDTEGYGIVLLESLACETPVITTNIAGLSRVIESQQLGSIVQTKDPIAIADAITKLLKNKQDLEAMSKKSRDYIVTHYSWHHIAQEVTHLYETL